MKVKTKLLACSEITFGCLLQPFLLFIFFTFVDCLKEISSRRLRQICHLHEALQLTKFVKPRLPLHHELFWVITKLQVKILVTLIFISAIEFDIAACRR